MNTAWLSLRVAGLFEPLGHSPAERRRWRLCWILGFWCVCVPTLAQAGGQVADCTQQSLLNAIAGGGVVTFPSNCSIALSAPIVIGPVSTTIDARGLNVTISGSNSVQLFNVGGDLHLLGLNLVNGKNANGGGLYINPGATVTASNCTFAGNNAVGAAGTAGAAGANKDYGFGGNGGDGSPGVPGLGGAIYNLGMLTLLNCTFATNTAVGGDGGAGGIGGSVGGTLGQGGNGGAGGSGGIGCGGAVYNLGFLQLLNCTFSGNSATGGNGGSGGAGGSSRTAGTNGSGIFPGLTGTGGAGSAGAGGGVYNNQTVTISGCTFSQNKAQGGTSAAGGNQVNGVGTTGANGGDGSGGGFCNALSAGLTNSTFYSNIVAGGTGGTGGAGSGTIPAAGNGGDGGNGNGGSLFNSGTMTVVNCTLSSGGAFGGTNGVAGTGGFAGSDGNPGAPRGGNIAVLAGSVDLRNTILANNVSGSNGYGSMTDDGYNLSSDYSVSLTATGSGMGVPLSLAPLANNGGPTLTMALVAGNPGINRIALSSFYPPTDQRGFLRPVGTGADVGAYEVGAATNRIAVTILQPTLSSSNRINIVVPTQFGRAYVLQYKNSMTNATWLSLSTNSGTGTWVTNWDLTTNQPGRFYRVLVQ